MEEIDGHKKEEEFEPFSIGVCGKTFLWKKKENECYIVKIFYSSFLYWDESIKNEIDALTHLSGVKNVPKIFDHHLKSECCRHSSDFYFKSHVPKIFDHYLKSDEYKHSAKIIMEYCQGPTLFEWLDQKNITPKVSETKKITFQIIETMIEIHSKGFAHNDLKPENIIYNPETEKISIMDFGFSTRINNEKLCKKPYWHNHQIFGDYQYAAPEHFNWKTTFNGIEKDTWSIGVLIYVIYKRKSLWLNEDLILMWDAKIVDPEQRIINSSLPQELEDLIFSILKRDPKERPSLETILKHCWFDEIRENKSS